MEEWRTIPECPNYEASSGGRIRNKNTHKVLAQYKAITGYMTIRLGGCNRYVHRLVCQAFHPCEMYKQYHCDHINHDKTDNRASNLRWLTREESVRNQIHKKKDPQ